MPTTVPVHVSAERRCDRAGHLHGDADRDARREHPLGHDPGHRRRDQRHPAALRGRPDQADGPDAVTDEDITDVPGDATKVFIAGPPQGHPDTALHRRPPDRDDLPERLARRRRHDRLPARRSSRPTFDGTAAFAGAVPVTRGPAQALRLGAGHRARIARADRSVHRRLAAERPVAVRVRHQLADRRRGTPTQGFIDAPGRARWYKFNVQPGLDAST